MDGIQKCLATQAIGNLAAQTVGNDLYPWDVLALLRRLVLEWITERLGICIPYVACRCL